MSKNDLKTNIPTGKKCICGGEIVEVFSKVYRNPNSKTLNPEIYFATKVVSSHFNCEVCGITYLATTYNKIEEGMEERMVSAKKLLHED